LADFHRLYPKLIANGKTGGNFRAEVAS